MFKKLRMLLALLLLLVSLALLIWAFWPGVVESRVIPVSPEDLQLPEPGALLFWFI